MQEVHTEDRTKSRLKRGRAVETPWWQHVKPGSLITSCTGKFRMANDLAKMNFRLPTTEWEDFFLETIAGLTPGSVTAGAVVVPEAERDDEDRVDLDDEADDEEDDIEGVFD
jgi:hypothetical protein